MALDFENGNDTLHFLTRLLPDEGVPQATVIGDRGALNIPCDDISKLAEEILRRDQLGHNVYHACATYHDGSSRKASNAAWMNTFWLDIDCGADKAATGAGYATKEEALKALRTYCRTVGLPRPMIVDSGGGLHVYWPLKASIPASRWKTPADKLKQATKASGFLADQSRTADAASILRPVGTHNRKYDPPRRVELLCDAHDIDIDVFEAALDSFLTRAAQGETPKGGKDGLAKLEGYVEPSSVSEGGRNTAVLKYVGHLRGKRVQEGLILGLAHNFNASKCHPPLDENEVAKIVATYSAQGNVDADGWRDPDPIEAALPDAPRFDYAMLPDRLRGLVRDASERMGVPPDYIAVPSMLSAAASLGAKYAICPKARDKGWKETPVLWGGIVAPPGSKKSPCLQLAAKPLQRIEAKLTDEYGKAKAEYDAVKKLLKAGEGTVQSAHEPFMQRAVFHDATYQKLAELCSTSPYGLMAQWDEVAGMVAAWSIKGQEAARGFFLTAWGGDQPYVVDRKESGTTRIERLFVVISGGVQPSVLGALVTAAKENGASNDGLVQRFQMFVYPDPNSAPDEIDRAADEIAESAAWDAIESLRYLTPSALGVEEETGTGRGILHFDDDAQKLFDQFRKKIDRKIRSGTVEPLLAAHLAKMPGAIAKIAMLIHLLDGGTGLVSLPATEKAIRWSLYLKGHAERIYALWKITQAEGMERVVRAIKEGKLSDGFTARDILRKGWHGLKNAAEVEKVLQELEQAGWLRQKASEANGRPTVKYDINPKTRSA